MLPQEMQTELVRGLIEIFRDNLDRIILYGSVARGEESEESDIDIAVVLKSQLEEETRKKFISWIAELDLKYERLFSVIDIENANMEKWGNVLPFYRNIQKEGIVLWKAA